MNTSKPRAEHHVENLEDIFLRNRPSIKNIWPEIFGTKSIEGKFSAKSVFIIGGETASGKSMLLQEIAARAIMIEDVKEITPEVLYINFVRDFRIQKFHQICSKLQSEDDAQFNYLEKIHVCTFGINNYKTALARLNFILRSNSSISLIVLDSLGYFYYLEAAKSETFLSKEKYLQLEIRMFKDLADKYAIPFICSLPDADLPSIIADDTHPIIVQKLKPDRFSMNLKAKDCDFEVHFAVEANGINLNEEASQEINKI